MKDLGRNINAKPIKYKELYPMSNSAFFFREVSFTETVSNKCMSPIWRALSHFILYVDF